MKKSLFLCGLLVQCFQVSCEQNPHTLRESVYTANAPEPVGPFSQAIRVQNNKETLYISGQLPIYSETGLLEDDVELATKQCMRNLLAILDEAGMDFNNVVKTTILLTDINEFPRVNKVYESFLQAPYPARMTYQVSALPKGGCVEIDMIAVK